MPTDDATRRANAAQPADVRCSGQEPTYPADETEEAVVAIRERLAAENAGLREELARARERAEKVEREAATADAEAQARRAMQRERDERAGERDAIAAVLDDVMGALAGLIPVVDLYTCGTKLTTLRCTECHCGDAQCAHDCEITRRIAAARAALPALSASAHEGGKL